MGPRRRQALLHLLRSAGAVALVATIAAGCAAAPTPTPVQAAAFDVSDLTVETAGSEVRPGDTVVVTAKVQNTGTAAGTYAADLVLDGAAAGHESIDLPAGQSGILRFQISAGAPGDYDVRVGGDVANLHVTKVSAAAFALSDLGVESRASGIQPGDAIVITARVRNTGDADGTYVADLLLGGAAAGHQSIDLSVGQAVILRFPVTAGTAGDYDLRLGTAKSVLHVLTPAAIEPTSIDVDPNPAETGDSLGIVVEVVNAGGLGGTQLVQLAIDGKAVGTREVALAGGAEAVLLFKVKAPGAGRHVVTAGNQKANLTVWRIERPASGKLLVNKIKGGMGQLKVKNGGDRDAVLILTKPSAPSKSLLAVYVRAGKTATVKGIKDGTYAAYFKQGSRWDGYSKAFTSDQELSRFRDTIRFQTSRTATTIRWKIWTLSLEAVAGGNAPTDPVDEGDFPGVP